MGVPKFFRWISERYPLCSQLTNDKQINIFDNLYLDMNGIIHVCSHPNGKKNNWISLDENPHFRLSEEQIFLNIFSYIDILFSKIRPQKLFFLAVDGCAPRAKMNQQRAVNWVNYSWILINKKFKNWNYFDDLNGCIVLPKWTPKKHKNRSFFSVVSDLQKMSKKQELKPLQKVKNYLKNRHLTVIVLRPAQWFSLINI